ncbi:hypothetical protein T12_5416 [Trichinella patagoniensis]|uniref:Uncharacterized protein n=1 Tax=Trichinella patagoniensis TaxID=990121 RepID=A0A0V0YR38_9BILA|nr:hypothetical protein T12_5416 [Trichinella patagoniensis]
MLARATIRFLLRVSSQSRPGSTSRVWTNGFQRLAADLTQNRATSLSHQHCTSLAATKAPMSSNLGRINRFMGATRVFAVTKLTNASGAEVSTRK